MTDAQVDANLMTTLKVNHNCQNTPQTWSLKTMYVYINNPDCSIPIAASYLIRTHLNWQLNILLSTELKRYLSKTVIKMNDEEHYLSIVSTNHYSCNLYQ